MSPRSLSVAKQLYTATSDPLESGERGQNINNLYFQVSRIVFLFCRPRPEIATYLPIDLLSKALKLQHDELTGLYAESLHEDKRNPVERRCDILDRARVLGWRLQRRRCRWRWRWRLEARMYNARRCSYSSVARAFARGHRLGYTNTSR